MLKLVVEQFGGSSCIEHIYKNGSTSIDFAIKQSELNMMQYLVNFMYSNFRINRIMPFGPLKTAIEVSSLQSIDILFKLFNKNNGTFSMNQKLAFEVKINLFYF
jgi:hypothetical protein